MALAHCILGKFRRYRKTIILEIVQSFGITKYLFGVAQKITISKFKGFLQGKLNFVITTFRKLKKKIIPRKLLCKREGSTYRGADKSLAQPGRKQANVSVRME